MFDLEPQNKRKEGEKPGSKPEPSKKQPGSDKDKKEPPKKPGLRFRIPPPIEAE